MKTNGESLVEPSPAVYSLTDCLPRCGQWVGVATPYFQCRGILDGGGKWHRTEGSVIENVQSWYLIDAEEVDTDQR
jgi:hypothetical protein